MTRNLLRVSSAVGISVMLLVGVVRTQSKAEEREAAVRKLCAAEKSAQEGRGAGPGGSTGGGGATGGSAGGLAGGLDPYSSYLTPQQGQ